jgi:hypothetical protein
VPSTHWRRLSEIAADAMERPPHERAAFLDRACGEDSGLRGEVERIVNAGDGLDSLLDSTTGTMRLSVTPTASVTPHGVPVAMPEPRDPRTARVPAELLERAARRLGTLVMVYAAGFVVAYALREITLHGIGDSPYVQAPHTGGQLIVAMFVGLALGVATLARRRTLPAPQLVTIGLVFEVVGSLGIALAS